MVFERAGRLYGLDPHGQVIRPRELASSTSRDTCLTGRASEIRTSIARLTSTAARICWAHGSGPVTSSGAIQHE